MRNRIKGFRIEDKNKIIMTSLADESELCSTFAFWARSRKIKHSGQIEIHPHSKGDCNNGEFSHAAMIAHATCHQCELWHLMNMSPY